MPKVERAIIMAAGLGNRMHPVTLSTPKPVSYTHLFMIWIFWAIFCILCITRMQGDFTDNKE